MIGNVKAVRRVLAGHDPADGPDRVPGYHKAATLERILATPAPTMPAPSRQSQPRRPAGRRAVWLLATGVAAALAAVLVTQLGMPGSGPGSLANAATPQPLAYQPEPGTARDVLGALASQVRADTPGQAPDSAAYQYVKTQSWSLSTRVDGKQVRSAVLPEVREVWRAPDGSGRMRITPGTPEFPSEQAEEAWRDEGAPAPQPSDQTYPAGGLAAMYPSTLPTDAAAMASLFAAGHPASNGPAATIMAVTDLYLEQAPAGPARAAVLEVLADTPGLELLGRTVDRIGRPGLAVAVDSAMSGLPTRYILVVDPADGRVLGHEQVLTTSAGQLGVPIPSTISYTAFVDAARTGDTEDRS